VVVLELFILTQYLTQLEFSCYYQRDKLICLSDLILFDKQIMKIENRTKNIIRFKTTIGSITLVPGINEFNKEQFDAVKAHPMFEDMVKTSGVIVIEEKVVKSYKTKAELKAEKELADKELADKETADLLGSDENISDKEESQKETFDLNEINLEDQNKTNLVAIAVSLEIETEGLNKKQLIEAINSKK
jgi:hypothetical protein